MKLSVYFTPAELAGVELPQQVVVVDVLRATSTVVEALSNGARALFPVATVDDAARIAQNIGRDSVLLCGERKALPIEGFDLGNAPSEFTRDRVEGKALVMTTTNGTGAFLAVAERQPGDGEPRSIMAGSFLNLSAVADRLRDTGDDVALVCAGREQRFALEDALLAGALVERLRSAASGMNDAARAARLLAEAQPDRHRSLEETAAGRHLAEIGRAEDVAFCAREDRASIVPTFRDRKITVE